MLKQTPLTECVVPRLPVDRVPVVTVEVIIILVVAAVAVEVAERDSGTACWGPA